MVLSHSSLNYLLLSLIFLVGFSLLYRSGFRIPRRINISLRHTPDRKLFDLKDRKYLLSAPCTNEYLQYRRSLIDTKAFQLTDVLLKQADVEGKLFLYDIDVNRDDYGMVAIRLVEFDDRGNRTRGGSSFLVTRISGARCWLNDLANGVYQGGCPPSKHSGCANLVIRRQSTWHALYRVMMNPMDFVILNRTICIEEPGTDQVYEYHQSLEIASWTHEDFNSTRLTHHFGKPITLLPTGEICRLIKSRYNHVSSMGASHTRYHFDYLLTHCFNITEFEGLRRKHDSFAIGNLDFKQCMFAREFKQNAIEELADFNITERSLFLLQYGAHDLNSYPYSKAMGEHMDIFMATVLRLCQLGVKVVVVATPPFPDHDKVMVRRYMRNNYAIAALNTKLSNKVNDLKMLFPRLEFFDLFSALLPWQDFDSRCGDHYMCRVPGSGISGNTGIQVFELLMTKLLT